MQAQALFETESQLDSSLESSVACRSLGILTRVERDLTSADHVLFRAGAITAASFDCPVDHPRFAGGGPLSCYYLVFPRTVTRIEHSQGAEFVATPNMVVLYSPSDAYARRAISKDGDHCDYLAIDAGFMLEWAQVQDAERRMLTSGNNFLRTNASVVPGTYLRQRLLFERLRLGSLSDPLEFEVAANELVAETMLGAAKLWGAHQDSSKRREIRVWNNQRERIEQVKALLATPESAACSLSWLARRVELAPSSLVRLFRAHTGFSVYQYALHLRLRQALGLLLDRDGEIADVAYQLGFTHQSHFGQHFRSAFGMTPATYVIRAHGRRPGLGWMNRSARRLNA
jgi:AraC-like DNA-binding protein